MNKFKLLQIQYELDLLGLSFEQAAILPCMVELLHKDNLLEENMNSSLADDIKLIEKNYPSLKGIDSFLSLSKDNPRYLNIYSSYLSLKKYAKWDAEDNINQFINDLINLNDVKRFNFIFNDNKLTPAIVDWLCDYKTVKKAIVPFNNNFNGLQEISLRSSITDVIEQVHDKSYIEKFILALLDKECSFVNKGYEELTQSNDTYDIGYSCPPIKINVDSDCRFSEIHVLNELYTKVTGRFACVLPLAFTFQSSVFAKSLREKYINEGRLAAVIKLPSGYLQNISIYTVALLFDKVGSKNKDIKMLDLTDNKFKDETLSLRNKFVLNETAINLFKAAMSNEKSCDYESVSIDKIKENDWSLDPGVYVMSSDVKESLKKVTTGSVRLDSIATFYRAQATKSEESGDTYLEVGAADINEFGFIENPSKELVLESDSKCLKNKIEKGDIVFSIKGSVGKVALVDKDVDNWLVNQSFVIIKIQDKSFTPEYVFRFLKGKAVKDYISINTIGSFIGAFPIDKLKSITLDKPTDDDLIEAKEKNERQLNLLKQIQEINDELRSLES